MSLPICVIDIGGGGLRSACVDPDAPPNGEAVKNLSRSGPVASLGQVIEFVKSTCHGTRAISVATAGTIQHHRYVAVSPNIPALNGVDLGGKIREATDLSTCIANDMETAATGMALLFPHMSSFWGMTISSGIGVRLVVNGKIISETEAGHMPAFTSPFASLCGCRNRGCAEAVLSGDAMTRRIVQETGIQKIDIPDGMHPCAFFDQELPKRGKWAVSIEEVFVEGMATFLAILLSCVRVEAMIFKGKFALRLDRTVFAMIKRRMRDNIIDPSWVDGLEFLFSPQEPKDLDSFLGAAQIAREMFSLY